MSYNSLDAKIKINSFILLLFNIIVSFEKYPFLIKLWDISYGKLEFFLYVKEFDSLNILFVKFFNSEPEIKKDNFQN